MPTVMTSLDRPFRLRSPHQRRPDATLWFWILFLLGFCTGWLMHTHLG